MHKLLGKKIYNLLRDVMNLRFLILESKITLHSLCNLSGRAKTYFGVISNELFHRIVCQSSKCKEWENLQFSSTSSGRIDLIIVLKICCVVN